MTGNSGRREPRAEIERANAAVGLDFIVESASGDEFVVISFNDDPPPHGRVLCRFRFGNPAYVQMPWRFSHRLLRVDTVGALGSPPMPKPWEQSETVPTVPSLAGLMVGQTDAGSLLITFSDASGSPREPDLYVVAETFDVEVLP